MWDSLYVMFNREQAILKSGSSLNAVMPFKLIKIPFRPLFYKRWVTVGFQSLGIYQFKINAKHVLSVFIHYKDKRKKYPKMSVV